MKSQLCSFVLAVCALCAFSSSAARAVEIRLVRSSGSGLSYVGPDGPTINAQGQVLFRAGSVGFWVEESPGTFLTYSNHLLLPDNTGARLDYIEQPFLMNDGSFFFRSSLYSTGVTSFNDYGLFTLGPAGLTQVARKGDQAVGLPAGVTYLNFDKDYDVLDFDRPSLVANQAGYVAFSADVFGPGIDSSNDSGVWVGRPDNLQLMITPGQSSPVAGLNFTSAGTPGINSSGHVVFRGSIGSDTSNNTGIFTNSSGAMQIIARESDIAAGTTRPITILDAFPVINNAGDIAFSGAVRRSPNASASQNDYGLWAHRNGGLELVAIAGDSAPGTSYFFGNITETKYVMNSQGRTAFTAPLEDLSSTRISNRSIWSEGRDGTLELVATKGDSAPGLPSGYTFDDEFEELAINGNGQVAFVARVVPDPHNNQYGIFAQDANFDLQLIALVGQPIPNSGFPGNVTFQYAFEGQSGGQDGRRVAFNDRGELTFVARTDTGQWGVFVATVPEPSGFVLGLLGVGAGLLGCLYARRKKSPCRE